MCGQAKHRGLGYHTLPRTVGYAFFLAMHVVNAYYLVTGFKPDVLREPGVKRYYDRMFRFLTIWNILAQIFYLALGLSCEVLKLAYEGKESLLLKTLKVIRESLFSSVVWPISWIVLTIFWPLFLYDRNLVLPADVDKVLSRASNHIIHTAIVVVVLWEAIFRPRRPPNSHLINLFLMFTYSFVYLVVVTATFLEDGVWVYPILTMATGTVYLYMMFGLAIVLLPLFYFGQWRLTNFMWAASHVKNY